MSGSVHTEVLARAAEILGGKMKLRELLRVSHLDLEAWMEGLARPPTFVFLRAVDLISESEKVDRGWKLRASLLRNAPAEARPCDMSPDEFAAKEYSPDEGALLVASALNAAVSGTAAARGNVQLVCPEGLRIVGHLGFKQPFLDFFACVSHDTPSTCGRAHELAQRVVVPDVVNHPIFAGTYAADVMEQAGALACQSTPLVSGTGELIGMLSTHYDKPHEPSPEELAVIDRVARIASRRLDGAAL